MVLIRNMYEHEAERVRDLWGQMCAEAGTPLPELATALILANLKQYATHQAVHCFVAEEQQILIGFVTCSVTGHPVMPGLAGEIEELYVQTGPYRQTVQVELVRHAVAFMKGCGAGSIRTQIGIGEESPEEEEQRVFWHSLGWPNDITTFSIYSNVPGSPPLQRVWDEYQVQTQPLPNT